MIQRFNTHGLGSVGSTFDVQNQITAAAIANGVDPNLALAVAKQESGFNQSAVSSAGAIGTFQLMPKTAAGLGVNPYDQAQNIQGGVQYLKQLQTQYNGNTALVLAAYNAGPGAVQRYGGVPPYAETQNYVSSILASPYLQTPGDTGSPDSLPSSQINAGGAADGYMPVDTPDGTEASEGLFLALALGIGALVWAVVD